MDAPRPREVLQDFIAYLERRKVNPTYREAVVRWVHEYLLEAEGK